MIAERTNYQTSDHWTLRRSNTKSGLEIDRFLSSNEIGDSQVVCFFTAFVSIFFAVLSPLLPITQDIINSKTFIFFPKYPHIKKKKKTIRVGRKIDSDFTHFQTTIFVNGYESIHLKILVFGSWSLGKSSREIRLKSCEVIWLKNKSLISFAQMNASLNDWKKLLNHSIF